MAFLTQALICLLCMQEEFRAKQASIFAALDKLYVLHNAVLVESRFIKAFFFYCCITFLVYLLTSAKQTFAIRGHLYFGQILRTSTQTLPTFRKAETSLNFFFLNMFICFMLGFCITLN